MSSPVSQLCPSCGTPVTPGAAFCENCGAEIVGGEASRTDDSPRPGPDEGGMGRPVEPEGEGDRPVEPENASSSPRPSVIDAAPRPLPPAESAFDADAPFVLEWDERRAFIEGVRCNFSFRIRCLTRMAQFGLCAEVDGGEPFCVWYSDLREGDVREGLFPFVPQTPGNVSVQYAIGAL